MKIIADIKIPFLQGVLEPFADVEYYTGSEISRAVVQNADALIIRTRTRCDASLLEGSKIKFIASATIGFDHIDTKYCEKKGIVWTNAPGCNSGSVMQYICYALLHYAHYKEIDLHNRVLGVIGVGNVGKKIVQLSEIFDMQVLLNDPPREQSEGPCGFISLDGLLRECDIISLHVPLTRTGFAKTLHLVDQKFLKKLNPGSLLINSSRGEVIDTNELKMSLSNGFPREVILDVWENEPELDIELLPKVLYATPHIAGYSADGKANGTQMTVQALSRYFGLGIDEWKPDDIPEPPIKKITCDGDNKSFQQLATEIVFQCYDFSMDDRMLKEKPHKFEWLRENYPLRREFHAFKVEGVNLPVEYKLKLAKLGFQVSDI
jgi:erythronate-4-phosphate dehydrogenase